MTPRVMHTLAGRWFMSIFEAGGYVSLGKSARDCAHLLIQSKDVMEAVLLRV